MSWINTLRTSTEDFGTLAENEPPTGCTGRIQRSPKVLKAIGDNWAFHSAAHRGQIHKIFKYASPGHGRCGAGSGPVGDDTAV